MIRKIVNNFNSPKMLLVKIASFITSMFPLSLFLVLKYYNEYTLFLGKIPRNIFANTLFIIEIFSIIYIIYFYKFKKTKGAVNVDKYHFENIIQQKNNTTNYLLANVLPVITLELDKTYNFIFFIVLFFLLGYMYVKNNMVHINPLYDFMNVKIYSCKIYKFSKNNPNIKIEIPNSTVISTIDIYGFDNSIYKGALLGDVLLVRE
ncbi:hypothetical protein [Clostridium gasigenes]|uniref:Uncharacterized protein n=1 Tax=Clostridium gasigenes TaxID=94869 RepID=A0A1H0VM93_9CLOT|nr:hypothetical protein [Clostridium gasigenes]MBU3106967.1 hypothetical protein [Clostridium gasigenes]SDP79325.1 hypothetical protein SAMN04488529_11770 [Clostridium gasigenes]